jgi:hypothetical protein
MFLSEPKPVFQVHCNIFHRVNRQDCTNSVTMYQVSLYDKSPEHVIIKAESEKCKYNLKIEGQDKLE